MALTYGEPLSRKYGAVTVSITKITFDTSYVNHGYELELKKLASPETPDELVDAIFAVGANNESTEYRGTFIKNASPYKLQLFSGASEVSASTNVSSFITYVVLISR